jgi:hypothetical protein
MPFLLSVVLWQEKRQEIFMRRYRYDDKAKRFTVLARRAKAGPSPTINKAVACEAGPQI